MLHYIIQTIVFQLLFLMVYELFLKKETFFNYNRFYLLITSVVSLFLPFVKLEILNAIIPQQYLVTLPEVILGNAENNLVAVNTINLDGFKSFSSMLTITNFYFFVTCIVFLFFIFKFYKIVSLIFKSERQKYNNLTIVNLEDTNTAFSFFNFIFLGKTLNKTDKQHILEHESIHAKQKHSLDLLWFETLKIIFWFNPLVYLYQKRISNLHEFIADQNALDTNKTEYYKQLLQQVFSVKSGAFINPFFKQSLIKKRITMLQKSKSKPVKLTKYLLLIPIVFGMLIYTSCQESKNDSDYEIEATKDVDITILTEQIKEQIAIKGNISDEEDSALKLLYRTFKGTKVDPKIVEEVNQLIKKDNKTKIEAKLATLFNVLQIRGNITDKDENAVKELLLLTIEDSFKDSFLEEVIETVELPYGTVEKTPQFPGCTNATEKENKACFSRAITKHVMTNFNASLSDSLNLSKGVKKIYTSFTISKTGDVKNIKVRTPHPDLDIETKRIIKMLPKMIPGSHEGKQVDVNYALPISFKIE